MENSKYIELKEIIISELKALEQNLNDSRDTSKVVDLNWESFTYLLKKLYSKDLEMHEE